MVQENRAGDHMRVRIAATDDEDEIIGLLKEFMAFEKVDLLSDEEFLSMVRTVMAMPERMQFLVAETDHIVGMLTIIHGYSTWKGKPIVTIEDVYVRTDVRGNGVASALLAYAFELAKEKGCDRVDLVSETENYPAQALYTKAGFELVPRIPFTKSL
jgi:ribosomal protein S18 acetylase RimI-like enzyme